MPYPLFYKQVVPAPDQLSVTLGGGGSIGIPRDSVVERIDIVVEGSITTAAATAAVEGLPRLLESVSLRGSARSAGQILPITQLRGDDLYELAQFKRGALTPIDGALGSTGFFRFVIPIHLRNYFLGNEIDNMRTALPAYDMSEFSLALKFASQAALDVNVSPTFVLGTTTCYLRIHQCYPGTQPADMVYLRATQEVSVDDAITTGTTRQFALPAGGDYSLILARSFSGANAKQANSGSAPYTTGAAQVIRVYDRNRFIKKESSFLDLRAENIDYTMDALVTGNAAIVYNRGKDLLFQTSGLDKSQSDIRIEANQTAATGAKIRYIYERIQDPNNVLQIARAF